MPDRRPPVQWRSDATPDWPPPAPRRPVARLLGAVVDAWPLLGLLGLWVLAGLVEGGMSLRLLATMAAAAVGVGVLGAWLAGMFDGER